MRLRTLFPLLLGLSVGVVQADRSHDLTYAPPSHTDESVTYVPVDLQTVAVQWTVAADLSRVEARAEVKFDTREAGHPFLLLNPNAVVELQLNSKATPVTIQKMKGKLFEKFNYFSLNLKLDPGSHRMSVVYSYVPDPQQALFLPNNYHSNSFVEAGIPCNLAFDHFAVTMDIAVVGSTPKTFRVIANGEVANPERNHFRISFPSYYTSMSFFLDLVDDALVAQRKDVVVTALEDHLPLEQRRRIPILVYGTWHEAGSSLVGVFRDLLMSDLPRLERLFGRYPYPMVIFKSVARDRKGGGAYAGAVALQDYYVSHVIHEIGHSWFMEDVSPANANDQWINEGLGYWSPTYLPGPEKNPKFEKSLDINANPYAITQNPGLKPGTSAHTTGAAILAAIDSRLLSKGKGGLLSYMRLIHQKKSRQTMNTREFKKLLETLSDEDLTDLFDYYFVSY